jgi:hypothetical protein
MRDREGVQRFLDISRAKLVCGYTKVVDWIESTAFDMLLLSALLDDVRIDARVNRLRARHPELVRILGFTSAPSFERAPAKSSPSHAVRRN